MEKSNYTIFIKMKLTAFAKATAVEESLKLLFRILIVFNNNIFIKINDHEKSSNDLHCNHYCRKHQGTGCKNGCIYATFQSFQSVRTLN